jgi:periplasmic protein TonB
MKPLRILFLFALIISVSIPNAYGNAMCIREYDSVAKRFIYLSVDDMPHYRGGMQNYFMSHFRYPPHETTFQTKIEVEVIVEENGKLSWKNIVGKQPAQFTTVEKETLAVIKKMPRWEPGKCKGKPVPVKMSFQLVYETR